MTDETRLSGTYGSDIDPLDDLQCEDYYPEQPSEWNEPYNAENDNYLTGDYDFDYNDEPYLWMDEVDEEIPF